MDVFIWAAVSFNGALPIQVGKLGWSRTDCLDYLSRLQWSPTHSGRETEMAFGGFVDRFYSFNGALPIQVGKPIAGRFHTR